MQRRTLVNISSVTVWMELRGHSRTRRSVEILMVKVSWYKEYYHRSSQDMYGYIPWSGVNNRVFE
jgi:hypothetical protein